MLAYIPALCSLALHLEENPRHEIWYTISGLGGHFKNLKVFRFICDWMCLRFEARSMPKLEILDLEFKYDSFAVEELGFDFGMNNLSSLINVSLKVSVSKDQEAAIRKAVGNHQDRPSLEIIRTRFISERGRNTSKQ